MKSSLICVIAVAIVLAVLQSPLAHSSPAQLDNHFYVVHSSGQDKGLIGQKALCSEAESQGAQSVLMRVWSGPVDNRFETISVNAEQYTEFNLAGPALKEKTIEEVLDDMSKGKPASSFHYRELSKQEKEELGPYFNALASLGSPEDLLDQGETEGKARQIGVSICHMYGREGMIFVCEMNPRYRRFVEHAWDGICGWQH